MKKLIAGTAVVTLILTGAGVAAAQTDNAPTSTTEAPAAEESAPTTEAPAADETDPDCAGRAERGDRGDGMGHGRLDPEGRRAPAQESGASL